MKEFREIGKATAKMVKQLQINEDIILEPWKLRNDKKRGELWRRWASRIER